jgi:Xaa-Pro aminopeptidase
MMSKKRNLYKRLKKLQHLLNKKQIPLLLISKPANITYLTGLLHIPDKYREIILVITPEKSIIFISVLRFNQQQSLSEFEVRPLTDQKVLSKTINKLVKASEKKEINFESEDLKVAELLKLEKRIKAKFVPKTGLIEDLRMFKDDIELKALRKACKIASTTWEQVKNIIKPGISEKEIANQIIEKLKINGADDVPEDFNPIVATGANSSIPHHTSSKTTIKSNQVVLVDFGCLIDGYSSDMSRTLKIGKQSKEFINVKRSVMSAYNRALAGLKDRKTNKQIDSEVISTLEEHGYKDKMPHSTGHGIGLEVHEKPMLSIKAKKPINIQPGMVLTIEPGIYIPNKFGFRFENTVAVTRDGFEALT